jgi:hypothetical protein
MISTCDNGSESVHMTDIDIESAFNLEATFEIIAAIDEDDHQNLAITMNHFLTVQVLLFAKKYDMKLVISAIRSYLFDLATQYPPTGGVFFLVAAHMSEWALCGRLIASFGTKRHGPEEANMRKMRKMVDWRGWTPNIMASLERVSRQFAWAVCQAGTKYATFNSVDESYLGNGIDYEGMGRSLAKLMNMWIGLSYGGSS